MSTTTQRAVGVTFGLVGWLFLVELVSGILQGFYVPLIPDLVEHLHIKDADFNWFEAAQLLLSAIVVPFLAKLGDMVGHKRILLISTVLTAGASWWLAFTGDFTTFLIAWALQGFYVVWLPLEVALIFDRGRTTGKGASQTRRAAGYLVVALEAGAIIGALGGGRLFTALGGNVTVTLMAPAIAVTLVFFAILFGVPESKPLPGRKLDTTGFVVLTLGLLLITSGLTFLKINIQSPMWWIAIPIMLAGVLVFIPWGRFELRQTGPGDRPAGAAPAEHVAGAADRRPGRDQPARRPGATGDVRRHRSGQRIRPGSGRQLDLLHHRRLPGIDDHRRPAVPAVVEVDEPAHRAHRRDVLRRDGISAVPPVPPDRADDVHEHGDRRDRVWALWSGHYPPRQRRRHPGARPASQPGSRTPRRPSAARSRRRSSRSCSSSAPARP